MAEKLNKESSIEFFKSDEQLWKNGTIELITDGCPPYIAFKIQVNEEKFIPGESIQGIILEAWYWDENYCPTPVIYPDLFNWKDRNITIEFSTEKWLDQESDPPADGKMIR